MSRLNTTSLAILLLTASMELFASRIEPANQPSVAVKTPTNNTFYSQLHHPRVQYYINYYSSKQSLALLERDFARSQPFTRYIEEQIRLYNLPKELIYLPLVESNYRNRATSHVGAAGIWQFMKGSSPAYGLAIDQWRDDRRDIYLATDAALRKIRDEQKKTGDIFLALAAYNSGLGRILRVKERCKEQKIEPTFWNMYTHKMLPKETLDYVPKLVAIAYLFENAGHYGLTLSQDAFDDIVAIKAAPSVSLRELADAISIDLTLLQVLNSGLKTDLTPDEQSKSYHIKVPASHANVTRIAMAERMADSTDRLYYVSQDDTLPTISKQLKISQKKLSKYNSHLDFSTLTEGERLLIPSKKSEPSSIKTVSYHVKPGDSLWAIALRYGLSSGALAQHNNINEKNILKVGLKLEVPL